MNGVAERIRDAAESGRRLRIAGSGSWLGAGRPTVADDTLSLADDRGIVEYVPGDLTLTARAGTPLRDVADATRAHGQWLALDPWGGDGGTLGATLSTATSGPYAHAAGLPRDNVLGIEFVTGAGRVVRAGGRVVKNVAGFDLTRLLIGSWGTLGVITEATVRLRALPAHVRTVTIAVHDERPGALTAMAVSLRALPFIPLVSELLNAAMAHRLGLPERSVLLVQLGGNAKSVSAQLDRLRSLGDAEAAPEDIVQSLALAEPRRSAVWRWSQLPSAFGETWHAAGRSCPEALVHGNPARGVARVIALADAAARMGDQRLAASATAFTGTVAIESLPSGAWPMVDASPASDPLSRAIRAKFDPRSVLNRGILGDA